MMRDVTAYVVRLQESTVLLALLILVVLFAIINGRVFLTGGNIRDLLVNSFFVMLVAVGMTFVLTSGGIDLSVGSVMGLSGAITGLMLLHDVPLVVAVLGGMLAAGGVGLANGVLIAHFGLPDFVVTIGMLSVIRGVVELMTHTSSITPASAAFENLTSGLTPLILVCCLVLLGGVVFRYTFFGAALLAVGMNRRAALLSGIDVRRVRVLVYVACALFAGAAGILLASYLSAVQPLAGQGYELSAIAAAVIGGTSLYGGRGTVWGTVLGALLLGTLLNGLTLAGVNAYWWTVVTGVIIAAAVALDRVLRVFRTAGLRRSDDRADLATPTLDQASPRGSLPVNDSRSWAE